MGGCYGCATCMSCATPSNSREARTSLYIVQGFIQDFKLGRGETVTRASMMHGILGGFGGMPPPENF